MPELRQAARRSEDIIGGSHSHWPIEQASAVKLRCSVYRFLTTDITGHRARIDTIAVDDEDATRQGEIYFESDATLVALVIESASGSSLRSFTKPPPSHECEGAIYD